MTVANPLQELYQGDQDVSFLTYGPCDGPSSGDGSGQTTTQESTVSPIEIVDSFGQYEAEYASIRKGVGVMALPQTGVVEVTGSERLEFLHRMLTADMNSLLPGQSRRAFLLNKAGRIVADAAVLHEADRSYLLTDAFQAPRLAGELESYLFTEDVAIRHTGDEWFHLALHGPAAAALVRRACGQTVADLEVSQHCRVTFADETSICFRRDETGSPGLHLLVARGGVAAVYKALLAAVDDEHTGDDLRGRCRPIGWQAYNTARIEAGTPLYYIDFGPDSLPHETGVLHEAVSFTKGCYLGQEIVARMQSLGHPKRVLVGLKSTENRLPIAGSEVFEPDGDTDRPGDIVGAVTSSTISPMLGGVAIAMAMVKWAKHQPGTRLIVPAEGQLIPVSVCELQFLK